MRAIANDTFKHHDNSSARCIERPSGNAILVPCTPTMNVVGKPYEGKPHVRFDVAGAGKGQHNATYQSSTLLNPGVGKGWAWEMLFSGTEERAGGYYPGGRHVT